MKHKAYLDIPLWYDEAYELGCAAIAACAENAEPQERIQTIAMLCSFHNRATYLHRGDGVETPESAAEQIAGLCAAIFREDIAKSEFGFVQPNVSNVMDNCGMGGDLVTTANVSTIAALIAAAGGINMCKHGSPGNTDRVGSSDFVELLGINAYMSKATAEQAVEQCHFGYTEALDTRFKHIHLQTHLYANLPHMNDIIGPITNPVDPSLMTRRVIGVNHLIEPQVVAEAYRILNQKGITNMQRLIAVRGYVEMGKSNGMDELSLCAGGSKIAMLENGVITERHIGSDYFGLESVAVEAISPPAGMKKGDFSIAILDGDIKGPALDMILANAALLFMLGQHLSPRQAYEAARDTFASGDVAKVISEVAKVSQDSVLA